MEPHAGVTLSRALQVVTRRNVGDTVSVVVGPAVLAVAALSLQHITYMQAANALFGYYLCEKLEARFRPYSCRAAHTCVFLLALGCSLVPGCASFLYRCGMRGGCCRE